MFKSKFLLPVFAAAITLGWMTPVTTASAVPLWQYIINDHSGKCVNVQGASTTNGTDLIQYTCGTAAGNDLWYFNDNQGIGYYEIVNKHSGKCANVKGASTSNSAPVIQYTCTAPQSDTLGNDVWYLANTNYANYYYIINERSGKCLNVSGAATGNGAAIIQYTCGAANHNDLWYID